MGVSGHEHVLVLVALLDEFVKETLYLIGHLHELMTCEEFQVYEHLVIAGTSGMDFLTEVAKFAREHQFHLRVHILYVVLNDKLAFLTSVIDIFQLGK